MNQTVKKIEEILKNAYNVDGYTDFVREIFPEVNIIAPHKFNQEYSNFSSHIVGSVHVGTYSDPDGKKLLIHSVQLKNESYVENSRSTQRSYAKKLIEAGGADAALVSYYTEGETRWRLSFVRLDYEIKFENGKLNTSEKMTPAKRYSYLVGKGEPCHTAISRFHRFIVDETNQLQPTLDDLEEAFSVEKVTEEFFKLYSEKFQQLMESLEDNEDFVMEASQHNFTSAQFAKKLMGQIVFLYFLQKKGWLGVKAWPNQLNEKEYKNAMYARGKKSRELIPQLYFLKDDGLYHISGKALEAISDDDEELLASCVKGNPWGTGPQNFMRKLFELAVKKGANYFDDYLEPLFYNALNVNRGEQGYDPALHCRIPFLSGGLFEPIDGYEWENNDFAIPNEIFSNKKDENDREGDGILDIFDRYNFTMSEDEPLEREVAIDPEMLGKVFENLLEVKDRKSKGAFYTPREIVHYMCQETLIAYLAKETGLKEKAVRDFILYGDFLKDVDTTKEKKQGNKSMLISEDIYKLDEKGMPIVNRLDSIDKALADIRVADPAVGSGAFPLGMINEIVRARNNISAYKAITIKATAHSDGEARNKIRMMYNTERSPYVLKRETIKNCIFGADIEPSAVDIARLRLWLSLVIDDEINPEASSELEGHPAPLPLPNLDCNIICGNSLIDEFEGVPLINNTALIGTDKNEQMDMYQSVYETILPPLFKAQDELFYCKNLDDKISLKEKIDALKDELTKVQMQGAADDWWEHYKSACKKASKPFVLWQIDFARVFKEKGGFDVVIGNPPYVQLQKTINEDTGEKLGDLYKKIGFETFIKTGDLYCLFYEKGYSLLREKGVLIFITSNKWMRAGYGEKLRNFFANKTNPVLLIDFAGQKIFNSATVDVNILLYEKSNNMHNTMACTVKERCKSNLSVYIEQSNIKMKFTSSNSWTIQSHIEQAIRFKIEKHGMPLKDWNISINRGVLTGFNEAFIISGEKRTELISIDPKSAEIIRPILRGRDIKRYECNFADLWLIATFPSKHYDIDDYPAIKDYLLSYGIERLEQTGNKHIINGIEVKARKKTSNKWFETQDSINYWDDFSKRKIVWGNLCLEAQFAMAPENFFVNAPSPMLVPGDYYLLAVMNSIVADWYIRQLGVTRNGGYFEYKPMFVEQLPIPDIDDTIKDAFREKAMLVEKNKSPELIDEINNMVFELYHLSFDEINYLKNYVEKKIKND